MFGNPALARLAAAAESYTLPFANGQRPLAQYPQKRPLIVLTARPPQLETPWEVFDEGVITPNDAFFVRYHLAGVPTDIDASTYRLTVKGKVTTPLSLTLADLRRMDAVEYHAVNQCSGNSRTRRGQAARQRRDGQREMAWRHAEIDPGEGGGPGSRTAGEVRWARRPRPSHDA
jgi:DMSO/TMAO reductase YedYZ molybdopterin-dependent catalytic subunit